MVKMRFAEAVLHGLKPRKIRYDVYDSEDTGLLLRVSPQGRKTWMVNYRSETGVKQQRALGKFPAMGVAEARQAAYVALNKSTERGASPDPA
jgi:Arm DNA-binding domain